jgi:hypothetical protein
MSRKGRHEADYQANTNQARHEPMPASHEDEHGRKAVTRNEEHAAAAAAQGKKDPAATRRGGKPSGRHRT